MIRAPVRRAPAHEGVTLQRLLPDRRLLRSERSEWPGSSRRASLQSGHAPNVVSQVLPHDAQVRPQRQVHLPRRRPHRSPLPVAHHGPREAHAWLYVLQRDKPHRPSLPLLCSGGLRAVLKGARVTLRVSRLMRALNVKPLLLTCSRARANCLPQIVSYRHLVKSCGDLLAMAGNRSAKTGRDAPSTRAPRAKCDASR